jgi:hypothetical protein
MSSASCRRTPVRGSSAVAVLWVIHVHCLDLCHEHRCAHQPVSAFNTVVVRAVVMTHSHRTDFFAVDRVDPDDRWLDAWNQDDIDSVPRS